MNLIDKKELLNERPEMLNPNMNDEIKSAYNKGWNACNSEWISLIDEQPTVYGLNKAMGQLEELEKEHPYKVIGQPDTYSQYNEAWRDCMDRVLSIVKRGSVENDG